jgi:hypothetical protein
MWISAYAEMTMGAGEGGDNGYTDCGLWICEKQGWDGVHNIM